MQRLNFEIFKEDAMIIKQFSYGMNEGEKLQKEEIAF